MKKEAVAVAPHKKQGFFGEIRQNFWLYMLIMPCILFAIVFKYNIIFIIL